VLQTKTIGSGKFRREWDNEGEIVPPFWITLQTATECLLDEADFGAIAPLVIGEFAFDTHVIEFERNFPAEKRIRAAVTAFWQAHDERIEPTPDYGRDGALISLIYPNAVPEKVVDLRSNTRIKALLEQRELQGGLIKEAEMRKVEAEVEIRHLMKDAEIALVDDWKVTLKQTDRAGYTVAPTSFRTLRSRRTLG
jgi:predicted phage-related endonuclease